MDLSLWQNIRILPPQALAISITKDVEKLFYGPAARTHLKDICRNWSDFTDDFLACLNADKWVTGYVKELVDVR
jgi:hypothetical protein